jgi:hypothetical protein
MRIILPPLKWDKTNDGPDVGEFFRWMVDYELSHLPPDTIFPRPGQIWATARDCEVGFEACIAWQGPQFSKLQLRSGEAVTIFGPAKPVSPFPFGTARLQKGEKVRILERADLTGFAGPKPIGVNFEPLRYEELESSIVPQELRNMPGYRGYRLCARTARPSSCFHAERTYLNEDFRLVEDVA